MKIAIIGATGGTGRKVIDRALELGHEVVAVARRPEVITPAERLSTRKGDVFDASSIAKVIAGKKKLLNVRAAKNVMTANFSPGTVMSEGIPNILAACQRAGVERLVQSGINLSDRNECESNTNKENDYGRKKFIY